MHRPGENMGRFFAAMVHGSGRLVYTTGGHPFVFDAGVRGRFVSVVVMPKQQLADYNPAEVQWLVDLFFADSPFA